MRKKRILHITEATHLKTGYANYSFELLKRLYETDKYEIAELGCFGRGDESERGGIPWKFYGNMPDQNNEEEKKFYYSSAMHSFGSWKIEQVCIDWQPDILFDIRDIWIMNFEETSPFRQKYHWCILPTVDATPLQMAWISSISNADSVLTYSDWGLKVLKDLNITNVRGSAPFGIDFNQFKPVQDKAAHKQSWGIPGDSFVIGTVMRNQNRKLYPELMKSFRMFLDQSPKQIGDKSLLFLHCSFPDSWDIPGLLAEHGISHKTIFTYVCKACNRSFLGFFGDAKGTCVHCHNQEAFLPNTHIGVDRNTLASIYNIFDIYVQYSENEGLGLSQIEAAASGVPIFSVDYSAMSDVVRKLKGYPIKVLALKRDSELGTDKAIPDNQDLVNSIIKYAELPQTWKNKKSFEARKACQTHYNWDNIAKTWMNCFDELPFMDENRWSSPPDIHAFPAEIPDGLDNEQFIEWAIPAFTGRKYLLSHSMRFRALRDLNWGSTTDNQDNTYYNELSVTGKKPIRKDFSRADFIEELKKIGIYKNFWEQKRYESTRKN